MVKVSKDELLQARIVFDKLGTTRANESSFRKFFGITKRQIQGFKSTGKLGVRAETAGKIRAMGKLRFVEPKYRLALYKAYLAQGDDHAAS